MEYEAVKEWLDALVENLEKEKALREFNDSISAAGNMTNDFIMYAGMDIVADVMGLEVSESKLPDSPDFTNQYKKEFTYRGVRFMSFSKKNKR